MEYGEVNKNWWEIKRERKKREVREARRASTERERYMNESDSQINSPGHGSRPFGPFNFG